MINQKGLSPILITLGIVFVLAVAGGSFFLGKNSQGNLQIQQGTATASVLNIAQSAFPQQVAASATSAAFKSISTPIPTPDPTANWKVYSNQKYGYSVKYPTNLQAVASETSYDQYVEFTLGRDPQGNAYLPNYTVTVAKDTFQAKDAASVNFLSADWVSSFYTMNVGESKSFQTITFKKLSNVNVADQSAVVMDVTASGDNQQRIFVKKNGYVYMITDFNHSAYFQNLLNTFTLTK